MPLLAREASQPTNLALPDACSSLIRRLLTALHKYATALPTFGAIQLTMAGHRAVRRQGNAGWATSGGGRTDGGSTSSIR
jgi:hypothetical protein